MSRKVVFQMLVISMIGGACMGFSYALLSHFCRAGHTEQEFLPAVQFFQGTGVFQGEMTRIVIMPWTDAQIAFHGHGIYGTRLNEAKTSAVKELEHQGYKVVEENSVWLEACDVPKGVILRYKDK